MSVVDYDSKWSTKFYKDWMFEFFAQSFCNTQIELYRVVDYDSKWSTKFHEDCMLDFFMIISLLRHLMIIF